MRRPDLPVLLLAAAFAATGSGCTGTSTESENTVVQAGAPQGRALLADGKPAPRARIALRTKEVVVKDSIPSWKIIDTATADARGVFAIRIPANREIWFEIREDAPQVPYPEVYLHRYDSTDVRPLKYGDLPMRPSGSVQGRLVPAQGAPRQNLWLGVAGTSVMARVEGVADSNGLPFRLDGLPAGTQTLTVVMVGGLMVSQHPAAPMPRAQIAGDTLTDLGKLIYEEAVTPRGP